MIMGVDTLGFKPGHLIDARGDFITIFGCQSISDAQNQLIDRGNQQNNMNYILSADFQGETGNITAKGQPVRLAPPPN
jgi:hypothetical protein